MTTGDEENDPDLMRSEIEACRAEIVSLRARIDRAERLAEGWREVAVAHACGDVVYAWGSGAGCDIRAENIPGDMP